MELLCLKNSHFCLSICLSCSSLIDSPFERLKHHQIALLRKEKKTIQYLRRAAEKESNPCELRIILICNKNQHEIHQKKLLNLQFLLHLRHLKMIKNLISLDMRALKFMRGD